MRTAKLVEFTGIHNHLANMEVGEGDYEHKYYSAGETTKEIFGYETVLLTVKTDEPNEWSLIRDLNHEFGGAGFTPW